jgi:hypothetical protein
MRLLGACVKWTQREKYFSVQKNPESKRLIAFNHLHSMRVAFYCRSAASHLMGNLI